MEAVVPGYFTNSRPFGNWSEVKVQVLSYAVQDMPFSSHPYAEYLIQLTKDGKTWRISKRYNQLAAFHKWILRNHMVDERVIPPFPDAPLLDLVLKEYEDVAEERKFKIEGYLEYLINVDEVFNSRPAQCFYELGHVLPDNQRNNVLMPLPSNSFELGQVSVIWKILTSLGNNVVFATENGKQAMNDPIQYEKKKGIAEAKRFFYDMRKETSFVNPIAFSEITPDSFSGVVLVGGFVPSAIVNYLDSAELHSKIRKLWSLGVPVGAISHGLLVLCRAKDKDTGHSLIRNSNTTAMSKLFEQTTRLLDILHPENYLLTYIEDEVRESLADPSTQFYPGPATAILQDSLFDPSSTFVYTDGKFLSARGTNDVYTFAKKFAEMVYHQGSHRT